MCHNLVVSYNAFLSSNNLLHQRLGDIGLALQNQLQPIVAQSQASKARLNLPVDQVSERHFNKADLSPKPLAQLHIEIEQA